MKLFLFFALVFALAMNVVAQSEPTVQYAGKGKARRVIAMSNMLGDADGMKCSKLSRPFVGTIVKRVFDEDETMIVNVVLRDAKDERNFINIDGAQILGLGRTAPTLLSSLLGKGKKVSISAYECSGGGSGIFYYANRVKAF
jgi:hypothetical protein